jgi:hypothetical protein
MKKKGFYGIILMFALILQLFPPMTAYGASGRITVAVSSNSISVGDTVTVTVSAVGPNSERAGANMKVKYDTSIYSFVECRADGYSGGPGGEVNAKASLFTLVLKAIAPGSGAITASGEGGYLTNANQALSAMESSGTSITVGGSASDSEAGSTNTNKSADNSLASIKLSAGKLSPKFKYNVTKYTATVSSDVTNINVEAKPSHPKAKISSIKGAKSLKEGKNTITIAVKAENKSVAKYIIEVTREAANSSTSPTDTKAGTEGNDGAEEPSGEESQVSADGIKINNVTYQVNGEFTDDSLPQDFVRETITFQQQAVNGVKHKNGELSLLYLTSESENGQNGFYVYSPEKNLFQPFVSITLGEKYVMALPADLVTEIPVDYNKTTLRVGERDGVSGFVFSGDEVQLGIGDFSLIYGMDNTGTTGMFRYDTIDNTLQRYVESYAPAGAGASGSTVDALKKQYSNLNKKYDKEKSSSRLFTAVLIFIIVVLVIVCINLILLRGTRRRKGGKKWGTKENDIWDDDDREDFAANEEPKEFIKEMDIVKAKKEYNDKEMIPAPRKEEKGDDEELEILDLNDF